MTLRANNVDHLKLDGAATTVLSDNLLFSNAAPTKTLLVETTNLAGTPYITMKCRGTAQSSIYQTNSSWFFAAQSANMTPRFTVYNGTNTITAMTISGSTGAVTMGVSPLTVVSTTYTSDARLKENIQTASPADCQALFEAVDVKTFNWIRDGKQSVGFIAQEVEAALPENGSLNDLVNQSEWQPTEEDEPMTIKTIDYSRMNTILWCVVKEHASKIAQLEARLTALEGNPP